eukprot:3775453-Prymnesium_polylepis.1
MVTWSWTCRSPPCMSLAAEDGCTSCCCTSRRLVDGCSPQLDSKIKNVQFRRFLASSFNPKASCMRLDVTFHPPGAGGWALEGQPKGSLRDEHERARTRARRCCSGARAAGRAARRVPPFTCCVIYRPNVF